MTGSAASPADRTPGQKRFAALGECMIEFAPAGHGLWQRGFAGDSFNAAMHFHGQAAQDWQTAYLTAVGDDDASDAMLAFMAEHGIRTDGIIRIGSASCGLYMVELDGAERRFTYWRQQSAARRLMEEPAAIARALGTCAALLYSGISLAILPPEGRDHLLTLVAAARQQGLVVAFDPNLRLRLWEGTTEARQWIGRAARECDVVLPTHDDEAALFGDVYVIQCATLVAVFVAVFSQIISDVGYTYLNPRIRFS